MTTNNQPYQTINLEQTTGSSVHSQGDATVYQENMQEQVSTNQEIPHNNIPPQQSQLQQKPVQNSTPVQDKNRRYCSYCGSVLKRDINNQYFCPNCGYRLTPPSNDLQKSEDGEKKDHEQAESKKENISRLIKVATWVVSAIILSYLLWSLYNIFNGFDSFM